MNILGNCITNKNEEFAAVLARIQAANRAYLFRLSLMKCHDINWRVQVTLQKTLIHSIMMYGSEARTLPKQAMNKIDSFEWKILQKISGPTNSQAVCRIKYS
jgi:hypothetical protein